MNTTLSHILLILSALPILASTPDSLGSGNLELEERLSSWKERAEAGDAAAARQVYLNYAVKGMHAQARAWAGQYTALLRRQAEQGDAKAMMLLGTQYMTGQDYTTPDPAEAIVWMTRASEAGEPSAAFILGQLYAQQGNHEQSRLQYARAYGLYKDIYSRQSDNTNALYWIGFMEQAGLGTEAAPAAGLEKLEQASREGNTWASTQLFKTYAQGIGVPKDQGKAIFYACQVADATENGMMAYAAAAAYLQGDGVEQDIQKGERYLEMAARANIPQAIYAKGLRLKEAGKAEAAYDCFSQAASMKHADAAVAAGRMLLYGEGIPADEATGLNYLNRACDRMESPRAPYELALYYDSKNEPELANTWMVTASNRGIIEAMARRGLLHLNPFSGLEWSPTRTYQWWRLGADAGDPTCQRYIWLFLYVFCPLLLILVFGLPAFIVHRLNKNAGNANRHS